MTSTAVVHSDNSWSPLEEVWLGDVYPADWVGCYTETYFELNCLVINEQTVMMLGYNRELEQQLAQRGVKIHWVPFRARSFWDGGMHCITLDIRRTSTVEDFFPERG